MNIAIDIKLSASHAVSRIEAAFEKHDWVPNFSERQRTKTIDWMYRDCPTMVKLYPAGDQVARIGIHVVDASHFPRATLNSAFGWLFDAVKWEIEEGRYTYGVPIPMHRFCLSLSKTRYPWVHTKCDETGLDLYGKGFDLHFEGMSSKPNVNKDDATKVWVTLNEEIMCQVSTPVDLVDSERVIALMQEKLPVFEWFAPCERRLENGLVETDDPNSWKDALAFSVNN